MSFERCDSLDPFPPRVLVVDDESTVTELFSLLLGRSGYRVDTAESVKEATDFIDSNHYKVILTDIVMDEESGFEIVRHVRTHDQDTAIVVISGYGSSENLVEALHLGADDFIVKPCSGPDLIHRVRLAIERRQTISARREALFLDRVAEALGAVSHEINNPLQVLTGVMELIESSGDHNSDREISSHLLEMKSAISAISKVVSRISKLKNLGIKNYADGIHILDLNVEDPDKSFPPVVLSQPTIMTPETAREQSRLPRLLIIDDEPMVADTMRRYLIKKGFSIDTAATASTGLDKFEKISYDIVILDVCLPDSDGLNVLSAMKASCAASGRPLPVVVMVTGFDTSDILKRCLDIGAAAALSKPVSLSYLYETIVKSQKRR